MVATCRLAYSIIVTPCCGFVSHLCCVHCCLTIQVIYYDNMARHMQFLGSADRNMTGHHALNPLNFFGESFFASSRFIEWLRLISLPV